MTGGWYGDAELRALGLGALGEDVRIDASAQLINPSKIFINSHVRIDAFAFLNAGPEGIHIGDHVHIAAGVYIFGGNGRVELGAFAGLAARVSLYTATDDYSGEFMTNPTVPDRYKRVQCGPVILGRHALVGAGAVIMPGVTLALGAGVGALSYLNAPVGEFEFFDGRPARKIGKRHRGLLRLEQELNDTP
jgi:galactoside O-acetyltransferase